MKVGAGSTSSSKEIDAGTYDEVSVVQLSRLKEWSAFEVCVWAGFQTPMTVDEVALAIAEKRFQTEPDRYCEYERKEHIERVAYLVVNPSDDPISLDVGIPVLNYFPYWIVTDGNHRLAAAFYRGDETIRASITGQVDYVLDRLGVQLDSAPLHRQM